MFFNITVSNDAMRSCSDQHLVLHTITDSYNQHLDCKGHITGGGAEMHNLDETLLVPEGEAGVCYGRNNKTEAVGRNQTTDKYCNNQNKIYYYNSSKRKVVAKTADGVTQTSDFCLVV